jgi:hypothetical protein
MADASFVLTLGGVPVPPLRQRKPETGERLDGTPKPRTETRCYYCPTEASVFIAYIIPACSVCFERFRRRD